MVGRLTLAQEAEVRILYPQPEKSVLEEERDLNRNLIVKGFAFVLAMVILALLTALKYVATPPGQPNKEASHRSIFLPRVFN